MSTFAATSCNTLVAVVVTFTREIQSGKNFLTLVERVTPCAPEYAELNVTDACCTSSVESQLS